MSCVHACILHGIINITGDTQVLRGSLRKVELIRCWCPSKRIIRHVAAIVTRNEPSDISLFLNVVPDPPTGTGNYFLPLTAGITFCAMSQMIIYFICLLFIYGSQSVK